MGPMPFFALFRRRKVTGLQQFLYDVFDVFADVARFSQSGGVGHDERYVEHTRQGLRQQRFT